MVRKVLLLMLLPEAPMVSEEAELLIQDWAALSVSVRFVLPTVTGWAPLLTAIPVPAIVSVWALVAESE